MLNVRKGDNVKILVGKDRGKTGKVLAVDAKGRVIVEGRNIYFRHERPKKSGEKGQKIQFPRSMDMSNLALLCPHCHKPTRGARTTDEKGQKSRLCKKCNKRI